MGGSGKPVLHGTLGIIVMSIGLLQPVNAFFRPHKVEGEEGCTKRRMWEYLHKGSGYTAVFLAMATIIIGTTLVPIPEAQTAFQAVYGVILVSLVLFIGFTVYDGYKVWQVNGEDRSGDNEEHLKATG